MPFDWNRGTNLITTIMKLLNKKQAIDAFYENGTDWFISALTSEFKFTPVDGDIDFSVEALVLKHEDYSKTTGNKPVNLHFYESFSCSCDHDCCGHVSSITIDVINNRNGYISVFLHTYFNY